MVLDISVSTGSVSAVIECTELLCGCRYLHGLDTGWVCGNHSWSTFLPGASVVQVENRYVLNGQVYRKF